MGIALLSGLASAILLAAPQRGGLEKPKRGAITIFSASLALAFFLLLYYFSTSDFQYHYVWRFSSSSYPLYYKLSGALAGQAGTLLFWAMLIALSALWLEKGGERKLAFVRHTQLIVVILGLYFTILTFLQSPFTTIYEAFPDISRGYIPLDGNGLNPILLDPWMASHPFTTFLGYAGTTIPFAGALVYLFTTARAGGGNSPAQKLWVTKGLQWLRFAWLFSTVSMAFGGIWAYKTLGWGGFWAWDPVETAMLLPWLMLTAAMHVALEHSRDGKRYGVLAPLLVAFSFSLVVYATAVTRSGIFESVHAFIAGSVGKFILLLVAVSFAIPLALALWKYFRTEVEAKDRGVINRTNIFYAAILVFLIIIFISFYGITFPPLMKQITAQKYAVTKQFFNLWLFPFFLLLLLLIGLGLEYKPKRRKEVVKSFSLFAVLTFTAALVKPTQDYNIVDYTSFVSASKPLLYSTIGEISSLSVLPPVLYIAYASLRRWRSFAKLKLRRKLREAGVIAIHIGVALIAVGAVFSTLFTSEFTATLNTNEIGEEKVLAQAKFHEGFGRLGTWGVHRGEGLSNYRIRLLDYGEHLDYGGASESSINLGMPIDEFRTAVESDSGREYAVRGTVSDVINGEHALLIKLTDESGELWVAADPALRIQAGKEVVALGTPSRDVKIHGSMVLLASGVTEAPLNYFKKVQLAEVEVFKGNARVAGGDVKFEKYRSGDARRPLIDRSLTRDVFVILDSPPYQGDLSLTVRIKPLLNEIWLGIGLLVLGIAVLISESWRRSE